MLDESKRIIAMIIYLIFPVKIVVHITVELFHLYLNCKSEVDNCVVYLLLISCQTLYQNTAHSNNFYNLMLSV